MANGSTRRLRRETRAEFSSESSSTEVVITSPTKCPRIHVHAQAASNRTCDAACFATQEGENDAIYTHRRPSHTKNDVAWHQGDSVATNKETCVITVSGSGPHVGFRKSSWMGGASQNVRRGGVVPVGDVSLDESKTAYPYP